MLLLTGHTCEVACQQEHNFLAVKNGIKVTEYETLTALAIDYLPYPTDLCDFCIARHKAGQAPACVKHCQARCMEFGHLQELVKAMVLFAPR